MNRLSPLRTSGFFFFMCMSLFSLETSSFAAKIKVKDAKGTYVQIRSIKRIVTLNGAITETLFALGVGRNIVGRDTSSYYPASVLRIPTVGYQHRLNAEGILRLRPTLVIGLSNVKPHSVIQQIRSAGVPVLLLTQPKHIASSKQMIRRLGRAVNKAKEAKQLIQKMDIQLKTLRTLRTQQKKKKRILFLYIRGTKMCFALGQQTYAGGMLQLIGATNALRVRYVKPISAEAMVTARPDVIVLFTKGVQSVGGMKGIYKIPGLHLTPAGRNRRFVIMDDLYLGGFGPRAGHAALDLFKGVSKTKGIVRALGQVSTK